MLKYFMEIKKVVGERLKESREEAGYTQNKIAALLNMTQQQYSRFEKVYLNLIMLNYNYYVKLSKYPQIICSFIR
jgi:transcriptional regulator with XRE-family HTH domain